MNRTSNGRGWAYTGTLLGALVSIAANVAHSFVPPVAAPASWQPPTGAILFAAFWPVALFVGIEMLARVAWRRGWRFSLLRFGGLLPVAGTAAIVSYLHLAGLLAHYGEPKITVVIGPLAVDGLMVMSAAALMSTSPRAVETAPATAPEPPVPDEPETVADLDGNRTPKPRPRTVKKTARKITQPRLSEDELLEAARSLNATALATTGEPVSLRKLKTELRIGHPGAVKLRDALLVTAPENTDPVAPEATVEHANGDPVPTR